MIKHITAITEESPHTIDKSFPFAVIIPVGIAIAARQKIATTSGHNFLVFMSTILYKGSPQKNHIFVKSKVYIIFNIFRLSLRKK